MAFIFTTYIDPRDLLHNIHMRALKVNEIFCNQLKKRWKNRANRYSLAGYFFFLFPPLSCTYIYLNTLNKRGVKLCKKIETAQLTISFLSVLNSSFDSTNIQKKKKNQQDFF